jgi:putative transposase
MTQSRFTEEQIIAVLSEQEAGLSAAEVYRKNGISTATFTATFYACMAKFVRGQVVRAA